MIRFKVLGFDALDSSLSCRVIESSDKILYSQFRVDPFVGLAVETNEAGSDSEEVGNSLVGKCFEMPDDTHIYRPTYLPNEGEFTEIAP